MSISYALVPPEPEPWEGNNDYDFLSDQDEETDASDTEQSYVSDTESERSFINTSKRKKIPEPAHLGVEYKNILQEEEYFSE